MDKPLKAHGSLTVTPRQQAMLAWIKCFVAIHGRAPTYEQIAKAHGINKGSVWCYLVALKKKVDFELLRTRGGPPRKMTAKTSTA